MNQYAKNIIDNLYKFIGRTTKDVANELCKEDDSFIIWWGLETTAYLGYKTLTDEHIQVIKSELREKYNCV